MAITHRIHAIREALFAPMAKAIPALGKPRPEAVAYKILSEFKDRQRADIQRWRRELEAAANPDSQRTCGLQDLIDNLSSDGHLVAQIGLRKAATLCTPFVVIDRKNGKEQPDKTDFFRRQWFYDALDDILDLPTRGYTLLELVDTASCRFSLIPRRNVLPHNRQIVLSVNDTKGIDYAGEIGNTLVEVGRPDDFGLLAELGGLLIWKRNAMQSWAEYIERYGHPMIIAKTTSSDDKEVNRIKNGLNELGEGMRSVLPENSSIEIMEVNTGGNYLVYEKQVARIDAEISKALVGGTMISDNGSSRSQSEVHERNLDDKIAEADKRQVTFIVNDQIIPMLQRWGHPFNPEVDRFVFEETYDISLTDHWNIVNSALYRYEVPTGWISKTFNIPITGEREVPQYAPPIAAQVPEGTGPVALAENFR